MSTAGNEVSRTLMNLKDLTFPYFFSIPRIIANPSSILGTPSHGLTNILGGPLWVLTLPPREYVFLPTFGGIGGVEDVSACAEVVRARLHHSALHEEKGDAVRPREVIMGRDGRSDGRRGDLTKCSHETDDKKGDYREKDSKHDHDATRT